MKVSICALALAVLAAVPAQAANSPDGSLINADIRQHDAASIDPQNLALARSLIDLLYPVETREQQYLEELREAWFEPLEEIEQPNIKAGLRSDLEQFMTNATQVVRAQYPKLMGGYAAAFASEYSTEELRQLVAFVGSPAGRRFLSRSENEGLAARIGEADSALMEALEPLADEMRTKLCQRHTQVRVAEGDANAKCSLA
jgi:hypothetical protein